MGVKRLGAPTLLLSLAVTAAGPAAADDGLNFEPHPRPGFERLSTLGNYLNNADLSDETVSEIVAASRDGRTLVYTDGSGADIGVVDITNPGSPVPQGKIPVGGEPTSVAVLGKGMALVGVNTSESFTNPSGHLAFVNLHKQAVVRTVDLGGQPDSVALSPDNRYVAVAIENERDEEVCVGGSGNGAPVPEDGPEASGDISADQCEDGGGVVGELPQTGIGNPPGYLVVIDLWKKTLKKVDLTGLAEYAPEDPEPEYVDINRRNLAVVTLQENNHLVLVDLRSASVVNHFSAGTVDLDGIDASEDGDIDPSDSLTAVAREPDAVSWVPYACNGEDGFATANEGDLFGGSRGFSIFCQDGSVAYDSGNSIERLAMAHGHYPEDRSENKGTEPEAVEYGKFGKLRYLFVGSERGSFVAVYRADRQGGAKFVQLLPAPLGPEGLLAIPQRGLLVVSGEEDDPDYGVRSTMMIYGLRGKADAYPGIVAEDGIGWAALSGMVAVPGARDTALAVWDSYYSVSKVFRIDTSASPAVITDAVSLSGGSGDYDPEGIAVAPDGTWWIASEGQAPGGRANRLLQTDTLGNVLQEIGLPDAIEACRAASSEGGSLGSGFEGVAVVPGEGASYRLVVAQQRGWTYTTPECLDLDDEAGFTRLWIYDPASAEWDHIAYELAPQPALASWVGLSEITRGPRGDYVLIERDNRTGDFAALKTLVRIDPRDAGDGIISAAEKSVYDLLPDLYQSNGWISDKAEGVSIDHRGRLYLVTDNDGVEDWSGETSFLDLGNYRRLFR